MANQWKFFIDLISNRDYLLLPALLLLIYITTYVLQRIFES